jgi:hypothetical protein
MDMRAIMPLATIVLIHAFGRYVGDPRPIDGVILRVVLSLWFVGLGVTYTLTWIGDQRGRQLLVGWGALSALGFFLDNLAILAAPPPQSIVAWNWVGVGLGIALAVVAYTSQRQPKP